MKHAMKTTLVLTVGALMTLSSLVLAQDKMGKMDKMDKMGGGVSAQDKMFMQMAEFSNIAEIKTSQVALKKATKPALKDFGKKMIDDHTTAEDELKQLASSKSVKLKNDTSPENKAALAKLMKLNGAAFDSSYSKVQKDGHDKTIAAFQKEISSGKDADVKAYAQKYLPAIQEHDKMITDMKAMKAMKPMSKMNKM